MAEKPETLPDHLRCNRTDGRQWRCNRPVVDGKKLCEVHYLQGRHRSNKERVPEELKIQRKLKNPDGKNDVGEGKSGKKRRKKKKKKGEVELGKRKRIIGESEALDKALKKMKLKKGDMELELIRMVLKREVEKRKKRRELEVESDSDDDDDELVTKDLPNGFMAISTAPSSLKNSNAGGEGSVFNVKVGVDVGTGGSRRIFRSKNIEPLPVGALQVAPFGCNVKKGQGKRCHWCRKRGRQNLVKCLSCSKEYFCLECIKQRYFDTPEEVKMACPVCRRSCRCKVCLENQSEEIEHKEKRDDRDVEKIVCLHYLICILLPILKKINEEQNNELEKEAKIKGIKPTELDIELTELTKQQCCSKWKTCKVGSGMLCPATQCGGCGDSLLNGGCIIPLEWTRKLQDFAEEIVCSYSIPETLDISSGCSYCLPLDHEDNRSKQQEAAMRDDFDNFLYYPTIMDIQNDKVDHFQKHWCRGQPVIVRNVLQSTSELTWDPVVMFSAYLESSIIKGKNGDGHSNSTNCPDWFEVDISTRQFFMGSLKGQMRPEMSQMLKLKAWLSSNLLQEHFPAHYAEIFQSLPLKEYMNPMSGILNLAAKVPQKITMPDFGPCVYITYGNRENIVQGEFVTKLSYGPYDVVNILAHASDVPISDEWLTKIEKLMRKRSHAQNCSDSTISKDKNVEEDITKGKSEPLNDKFQGAGLQNITRDANLHKRVTGAFGFSSGSYEARSLVSEDKNISYDRIHYGHDISDVACGSQWDVFRRQDVPKLLEYLRRHSDEFFQTYNSQEHVIHPIFDRSLFLDNTHKTRLKEEFQIEPWTFVQRIGEAVIIPAGCPYQIKTLKSCVNVVLDFVSPESVTESIQINNQIRMLPEDHKAKVDKLELKNIALNGISEAIREIRELTTGKENAEVGVRIYNS